VDRAFAAVGLERQVTTEVADVTTLINLVRAGLGMALLPVSLLPGGDGPLLRRPVSPRISWHVVMATPSGRTNAAANALAELVTESLDRGLQRVSPPHGKGHRAGTRSK